VAPLAIAPGPPGAIADAVGAHLLTNDPVTAAERMTSPGTATVNAPERLRIFLRQTIRRVSS